MYFFICIFFFLQSRHLSYELSGIMTLLIMMLIHPAIFVPLIFRNFCLVRLCCPEWCNFWVKQFSVTNILMDVWYNSARNFLYWDYVTPGCSISQDACVFATILLVLSCRCRFLFVFVQKPGDELVNVTMPGYFGSCWLIFYSVCPCKALSV